MRINKTRRNKKALLGEMIMMFIATIFIVLILTLFAFASGVIKKLSNSDEGILTEKKIEGEINMGDYCESFGNLTNLRFLLNEQDASGKKTYTFEEALEKSGVRG